MGLSIDPPPAIAGRLEFDIDLRKARWYEAWANVSNPQPLRGTPIKRDREQPKTLHPLHLSSQPGPSLTGLPRRASDVGSSTPPTSSFASRHTIPPAQNLRSGLRSFTITDTQRKIEEEPCEPIDETSPDSHDGLSDTSDPEHVPVAKTEEQTEGAAEAFAQTSPSDSIHPKMKDENESETIELKSSTGTEDVASKPSSVHEVEAFDGSETETHPQPEPKAPTTLSAPVFTHDEPINREEPKERYDIQAPEQEAHLVSPQKKLDPPLSAPDRSSDDNIQPGIIHPAPQTALKYATSHLEEPYRDEVIEGQVHRSDCETTDSRHVYPIQANKADLTILLTGHQVSESPDDEELLIAERQMLEAMNAAEAERVEAERKAFARLLAEKTLNQSQVKTTEVAEPTDLSHVQTVEGAERTDPSQVNTMEVVEQTLAEAQVERRVVAEEQTHNESQLKTTELVEQTETEPVLTPKADAERTGIPEEPSQTTAKQCESDISKVAPKPTGSDIDTHKPRHLRQSSTTFSTGSISSAASSIRRFSGDRFFGRRKSQAVRDEEEAQKLVEEMNRLVNEKAQETDAVLVAASATSNRQSRSTSPIPSTPAKEGPRMPPVPPTRSKVMMLAKAFARDDLIVSGPPVLSPQFQSSSRSSLSSTMTLEPAPPPPPVLTTPEALDFPVRQSAYWVRVDRSLVW